MRTSFENLCVSNFTNSTHSEDESDSNIIKRRKIIKINRQKYEIIFYNKIDYLHKKT